MGMFREDQRDAMYELIFMKIYQQLGGNPEDLAGAGAGDGGNGATRTGEDFGAGTGGLPIGDRSPNEEVL
jgi:hypothetical protein